MVPDSEVDESDMIPALDRPRLRTSGRLKILQLKRYLTRKMNVQGVEANMVSSQPQPNGHIQDTPPFAKKERKKERKKETTTTVPVSLSLSLSLSLGRFLRIYMHVYLTDARFVCPCSPMIFVCVQIEIICNGVVLGNELSLTFIDRTVWFDKHSTMEFIYRLAEEA